MSFDLKSLPRPLARLVQLQLKAQGYYTGTTAGLPGPKTQAAYEEYLRAGAAKSNPSLSSADNEAMREAFVEILRGEIGVREQGGNNRGPRVQEYQDAASWVDGTGWAWCAAFICWGFDRLAERFKLPFATPEGAGAFWFEDWARQQKLPVFSGKAKVRRGDLIIYSFSHIGCATSDEKDGLFLCVEGNTNDGGSRDGDGVFERRRMKNSVRSIIRPFP